MVKGAHHHGYVLPTHEELDWMWLCLCFWVCLWLAISLPPFSPTLPAPFPFARFAPFGRDFAFAFGLGSALGRPLAASRAEGCSGLGPVCMLP